MVTADRDRHATHRAAVALQTAADELGAFSTVDGVLWKLRDRAADLLTTLETPMSTGPDKVCPRRGQAVTR